jgi:tetratricopeptide (TPR) repeat protein
MLGANIEEGRMIVADTVQDWPKTRDHATRAVSYLDRVEKTRGFSEDLIQDASRIHLHVGQALMNIHQYEDAVVQIEHGIDLARRPGASPNMLAQGLSVLANARRQKGDLDGALAAITEARARMETATFPNETSRASALYAILWRQGVILGEDESVSLNRPADAVEPLQKAFDLVDQMAAKDPNDVTFRDKVGTAGQQLGDILRHSDPRRALEIYDRTLKRIAEIKKGAPARRMEARLLAHSSYPLRSLHRSIEARRRIDAAFEMLYALGEKESGIGTIGGEWDNAMRASADLELEAGHAQKARDILLELQSKLLELHPNPESDLRHANDMSRLYDSLAEVDARLNQKDEARSFETQKADLWRLWDRKLPNNPFVRRHMEGL